ncbi:putative cysteine desulfurase [Rubripirellula lacrimiformis]|uniref:Cysteine desulfurase n=1 Tax=Rubripirellula lacrimiformis TaxID=1930273 RepID=A0A517NG90_9BACT|nr:SufS family cysteine desulfurase [Rubripirellula lacrimiformis]QDT06146.1 putative cysteine desulfurase [Rubripirellula lacrimiformis]
MNTVTSDAISDLDVSRYRADFPILDRTAASGAKLAFLDNAASTQRPNSVVDAMSDCYRRYYANVHRGIHTLSEESTHAYEQSRKSVAKFIAAPSDRQVIFAGGATAAINTVARTWGDANLGPDDVILLTIAEHHANIVPWHQLAARTGCRVEFLPIDDQFTIADDVVVEALDRLKPKLFAFTAASNTLGTVFPVKRWTALAHDHGATVLVDAAQAAPHAVVDVQDWDIDFLAFSGHKVCGPTGIGVLYGKEPILDAMPPFMGGGGMIHKVTTGGFSCAELPEKFEAGTPPIVEAIGLAAAVEYLADIGLDRIAAHEHRLCQHADDGLRQIDGVDVVGPTPDHKGGIVSFHVDGVHAHDVSQQLDTRGIAVRAGHHCTMPLHHHLKLSATTRASFYFYNTVEEADRLIEAVREVRQKFAPSGRKRRRRSE